MRKLYLLVEPKQIVPFVDLADPTTLEALGGVILHVGESQLKSFGY